MQAEQQGQDPPFQMSYERLKDSCFVFRYEMLKAAHLHVAHLYPQIETLYLVRLPDPGWRHEPLCVWARVRPHYPNLPGSLPRRENMDWVWDGVLRFG